MTAARRLSHFLRDGSAASAIANVALTNGFVLCVNVLTGVVTARSLGAQGRGELAAIILWPQLLGYVFALGLPSALLYNAKKNPNERRQIAAMAFMASVVCGLVAVVAGEALLPLLLLHVSADTLRYAHWMMLCAFPATVSTVLIALLQLEEQFHFYNRLRYLPLVATLAALLLLAAAGKLTPLTAALAYFVPGIGVFVWCTGWVASNIRPQLRGARRTLRPLMWYAVRAYGGEAANTLMAQMDKMFLVNLLSAPAFGVYVVVFNLSRVITALSAAIAPVLLPKSAGRSAHEVTMMTARVLSVSTPLLLLPALAFMLTGSVLLRWLYGPGFALGHLALSGLILEAVIASVTNVITQPYLALNRPGVITVIQATSLPVLAVAMWLLVPGFGINGAAAALLLSTIYRAAATYLAYQRLLNVPAPRLWPDLQQSRELVRRLRSAP